MDREEVRVFLSYSHKDQALIDQLIAHLGALKLLGVIQAWTAQTIETGTQWDKAIVPYLDSADIILLALSADFLASDYSAAEVGEALKRHVAKQAHVIPVLLRPIDLANTPFAHLFAHLQSLPNNGKPITLWEDRDAAFLSVAKDIQRTAEALKAQAAVRDP